MPIWLTSLSQIGRRLGSSGTLPASLGLLRARRLKYRNPHAISSRSSISIYEILMKANFANFWQVCLLLWAVALMQCTAEQAQAGEGGGIDSTCKELNRAYVNSRTTPYYSSDAYRVEPSGTRRHAFEVRVASSYSYQKNPPGQAWFSVNRPPSSLLAASGRPKFTSCKPLGEQALSVGDTTRYSFDWHGPETSASGEVWIEKSADRIAYLLRRFPPQSDGRPAIMLEVFDYDPVRATTVPPLEGSPAPSSPSKSPKTDPSCSAVNKAYLQTRSAGAYSETWYRVEKGGKLKLHSEFRATYMGGSYKLAAADKWLESDRPLPKLLDRYAAIFERCKPLSRKSDKAAIVRRYSTLWHDFPYEAAAEVLIGPDGRISKIFYRYLDGRWQLPTEKAQAIFSYDNR